MNTNKEIIEEFQKLDLNVPTLSSKVKYWYIREHETPRYTLDIDKEIIYVNIPQLESVAYDTDRSNNRNKKNYYHDFLQLNKEDILLYFDPHKKNIYFLRVNSTLESSNLNNESQNEIKVTFIKKIRKSELNLKLKNYIDNKRSYFIDVSKHSSIIDSIIHSLYIKNNEVVLTIRVTQKESLRTENLANLVNLPWLTKELFKNSNIDLSELRSTICIQSPGFITFKSKDVAGTKIIGEILLIISLISSGGKISAENPYGSYSIESNGSLKEITELIKEHNRHEETIIKENNRHEEVIIKEKNKTLDKIIKLSQETGMNVEDINNYINNNQ